MIRAFAHAFGRELARRLVGLVIAGALYAWLREALLRRELRAIDARLEEVKAAWDTATTPAPLRPIRVSVTPRPE